MSFLAYASGVDGPVIPDDGTQARSTVTVVVPNEPAAVAPDAPDFNERATDGQTEGGLTPHQVASAVTPSVQYPPAPLSTVDDAIERIINDGQSTKGYAAMLERLGRWGHGTMKIVQGIEPAISSAPFADNYFAADNRPVTSTDYMQPVAPNPAQAAANAVAVNNAAVASPYDVLKGW